MLSSSSTPQATVRSAIRPCRSRASTRQSRWCGVSASDLRRPQSKRQKPQFAMTRPLCRSRVSGAINSGSIDDFDHAPRTVDDNGMMVDHRVAIAWPHVIVRRDGVVTDRSIGQYNTDAHVTVVFIGRNVLLNDIMVKARIIIDAEEPCYASGDTPDNTATDRTDRTRRRAAFGCATLRTSHHTLRLCS